MIVEAPPLKVNKYRPRNLTPEKVSTKTPLPVIMTRFITDMEQQINILGMRIAAVSMDEATRELERLILARRGGYVCVSNVHTVMESQFDPQFKRINNHADLSVPDGMPLIWAARALGVPLKERVYGPDFMLNFLKYSEPKGYRHFFYGGTPRILDRLKQNFEKRFSKIRIAGAIAPPFRALTPEEDADHVRQINAAHPDVVWLGLGTPKQHYWMAGHRDRIHAVQIGVGAAFDFHSGAVRQAPKWMQLRGLEWFYRLTQEPRRLWKRYLIYNPLFLMYFGLQWAGWKRFRDDRPV